MEAVYVAEAPLGARTAAYISPFRFEYRYTPPVGVMTPFPLTVPFTFTSPLNPFEIEDSARVMVEGRDGAVEITFT